MGEGEYHWEPLAPADGVDAVTRAGIRCWVAGGWAIDLYLGQATRSHGDLDLSVLRDEHAALATLHDDWDVHLADSGTLTPWDGSPLSQEQHQFWVKRPGAEAWSFEILIEDHEGEHWRYRRDARVTLPIARFGISTREGVPIVAPEIALLYKAKWHELDRNAQDFSAIAPELAQEAWAWLRSTLEMVSPGHPWIARLDDARRP